jgi:hypothetical protein
MRKYRAGLVPSHQNLSQLDEVVRDAILGSVGTMTSFSVGPDRRAAARKRVLPAIPRERLGQPPELPHLFQASDRQRGVEAV